MENKHELVGDVITNVRDMTRDEVEAEGWWSSSDITVIELKSGIKLYASRDEEGNGPGEIFAVRGTTHLRILPIARSR